MKSGVICAGLMGAEIALVAGWAARGAGRIEASGNGQEKA